MAENWDMKKIAYRLDLFKAIGSSKWRKPDAIENGKKSVCFFLLNSVTLMWSSAWRAYRSSSSWQAGNGRQSCHGDHAAGAACRSWRESWTTKTWTAEGESEIARRCHGRMRVFYSYWKLWIACDCRRLQPQQSTKSPSLALVFDLTACGWFVSNCQSLDSCLSTDKVVLSGWGAE